MTTPPSASRWRTQGHVLATLRFWSARRRIRFHAFAALFGVALFLGAGLWIQSRGLQMAPLLPLIDQSLLTGTVASLAAALLLGGYTRVSFQSTAQALLAALPLEKRSVWGARVWDLWFAGASLGSIFALGILALITANGAASIRSLPFSVAGGAFLLGPLQMSIQYLYLLSRPRARTMRIAIWISLAAFAAAAPAAFAVTGDAGASALLAGPGYVVAVALSAAADLGAAGLAFMAVLSLAASFLLFFAPLPEAVLRQGVDELANAITMPYPIAEADPLPNAAAPGRGAAASRPAGALSALAHPATDLGEIAPLAVPADRESALRFYLVGDPPGRKGFVLPLAVLAVFFLAALALMALGNWTPRFVIPRPDGNRVLAGAWAGLIVLVAFFGAPGRPRPWGRRVRSGGLWTPLPRPAAREYRWRVGIVRWEALQTLPVDRDLLFRVLYRPRWKLLAAITAVPLAILAASLPVLTFLEAVALAVVVAGPFLGAVAIPGLLVSAVPRGYRRWRGFARAAAGLGWLVGGLALGLSAGRLAAHAAVGTPLGQAELAFLAVAAGVAICQPWIIAAVLRERLVVSQRPYETDTRLFGATASGVTMLVAGLLGLIAF